MLSLFRSPLVRLAGKLGWLPALGLITAIGAVSAETGPALLLGGLATGGALAGGAFGAALGHGALAAARHRARRAAGRFRFLCPRCLQFGGFHWACAECGSEIEAFEFHTHGLYSGACRHCQAPLSGEGSGTQRVPGVQSERRTPNGLGLGLGLGARTPNAGYPLGGRTPNAVPAQSLRAQALCRRCDDLSDLAAHERQVRVLGTTAGSFGALRRAGRARERRGEGMRYLVRDDGRCLTYVLNLDDPADAVRGFPRAHAARAVEAVWIDGAASGALEIGHAVDRYLRRAELSRDRRRAIRLCVRQPLHSSGGTGADGPPLDLSALHLLEARFGALLHGIKAEAFLRGEPESGLLHQS